MTDRLKGLIVTFQPNMREDDAQSRIEAIKLLSGVIDVQPLVENFDHIIAVEQAKNELRQKLIDVIK